MRAPRAELSWTFGVRRGTFRTAETSRTVRHTDLGLLSAPTVASTSFELALDRTASISGSPLFPGDTIRLALESGAGADWLPDAPTGVRLVLKPERERTTPSGARGAHELVRSRERPRDSRPQLQRARRRALRSRARLGELTETDPDGWYAAGAGRDLVDVAPRTTGLPTNFTWYSPDSDYPPGRLDYLFVTDSVLEVEREFVLFTPALPESLRGALGLRADDVPRASDHLPVVADLVLR